MKLADTVREKSASRGAVRESLRSVAGPRHHPDALPRIPQGVHDAEEPGSQPSGRGDPGVTNPAWRERANRRGDETRLLQENGHALAAEVVTLLVDKGLMRMARKESVEPIVTQDEAPQPSYGRVTVLHVEDEEALGSEHATDLPESLDGIRMQPRCNWPCARAMSRRGLSYGSG